MDHALFIDVLKPQQRLVDDADRLAWWQLPPPMKHVVERLAFEILHDDIVQPVGLADLKRPNDVGML